MPVNLSLKISDIDYVLLECEGRAAGRSLKEQVRKTPTEHVGRRYEPLTGAEIVSADDNLHLVFDLSR